MFQMSLFGAWSNFRLKKMFLVLILFSKENGEYQHKSPWNHSTGSKSATILKVGSVATGSRTPPPLWKSQQEAEARSFWVHTFNSPLKLSQKLFYLHGSKAAAKHHLIQTIEFRQKNQKKLFQVCSSRLSSSKKHLSGQASEEPLRSNSPKASGTSHSERGEDRERGTSSSGRLGAIQQQALLLAPLWDSIGLKKAAAPMYRFPNGKWQDSYENGLFLIKGPAMAQNKMQQ